MRSIKFYAILCVMLVFSALLQAQDKLSTIKIYAPADKHQRSELLGLLQIDHYVTDEQGAITVQITPKEMAKLKRTGYRYEVLVADVEKELIELNKKYNMERKKGLINMDGTSRAAVQQVNKSVSTIIGTPTDFVVQPTFSGYYSYSQMIEAVDQLVQDYPTLAKKIPLTTLTHEGRTIYVVKISDDVNNESEANEPQILYMGLQHAREAIGGSSMIFLMQYLCEFYSKDSKIKDLVDNRVFYIIPCMNPDGYERNRRTNPNGGGAQRKNRRKNTGNDSSGAGVDLNRNWGVDWGTCGSVTCGSSGSCGSSIADDETYYGTGAFSEPETQAVRDFVTSKNIVAAIDQHAFGPYYSLPYGKTARTLTAEESKIFTHIPALMGHYNGMRAGNSCESVGYEVAGGVKDWWLIGDIGTGTKGKIIGMTGEGGAGGGNSAWASLGTVNFWPPSGQIVNLCKGMVYQNLQLAFAAGSYVTISDTSGLSTSTKAGGKMYFKATRVGLADEQVTVSLIPIQNMQSAAAPKQFNIANYGDIYYDSIGYTLYPLLTNGQVVKFAWKVQTGGYTYYDTVTKIYNGTQLIHDKMETMSASWTLNPSTGGFGVTSGSTQGFGGGKALSESPTGNYTSGLTRYATWGSSINLGTTTAAYISFWVRHRAENFRDKLQLQVSTNSTNGTNGTWVAIPGTTTVQEPGTLDGSTINGAASLTGIQTDWTRELFDLTAYLGQTNFRFRFAFTSDNSTSGGFDFHVDDGFYIDNVQMMTSTATLQTLSTHFLDLTGKLLSDKKIQLDWKATIDETHDYFEVERSANGIDFETIGKVNDAGFRFLDAAPLVGNNFYRIKAVSKDGKSDISKTVTVVFNNGKTKLSVYPNPAQDVIHVNISADRPEAMYVQIVDVQGREVFRKFYPASNASNAIDVNVSSFISQVYLLKVTNSKNEVLATQRFIKQ